MELILLGFNITFQTYHRQYSTHWPNWGPKQKFIQCVCKILLGHIHKMSFRCDVVQDFSVSTVPVCDGIRLKNICSMGGANTIVISNSEGAKKTLRVGVFCLCGTF